MPVLKLYQNGLTAGCPPPGRPQVCLPSLRDECKGWSLKSSRSNTRFLYSIRSADLPVSKDGKPLLGLSGSCTIRFIPDSHDGWKKLRESFIRCLRKKGMYRLHWLTEWQQRGAPHLHFAAWFYEEYVSNAIGVFGLPTEAFSALVKADWLRRSARFGSSADGQEIKPIFDEMGWFRYLSKHASRGASHYQRALGSIPAGWEKTGRMWGHIGNFPTSEPISIELEDPHWFAFRRIARSWRIAQARASGKACRISSARRMLQCSKPSLSTVRGISEWISHDIGEAIFKVVVDEVTEVRWNPRTRNWERVHPKPNLPG